MAVMCVGKRGDRVKERCLLGAARSPLQSGLVQQSSAQQMSICLYLPLAGLLGRRAFPKVGVPVALLRCITIYLVNSCSSNLIVLIHLKFSTWIFLSMNCLVPMISGGWPGLMRETY